MRRQRLLALIALLLCNAILAAQTANTTKLKGQVDDSTGGVMIGANVQVSTVTPARVVASAKTDEMGQFEMDIAPGQYLLKVMVPDFKDISQTIRVAPDMEPLSITMSLNLTTQVNVTSTDSTELSLDPDSSLNTDVITGDALLDLPDNPDDPAGIPPAAGPAARWRGRRHYQRRRI